MSAFERQLWGRMTKTKARGIARLARQHGYFQSGVAEVAVNCPVCRKRVSAHHGAFDGKVTKVLDAAMVKHLLHDCEDAR